MTGATKDTSLTIDTHHHIARLFLEETENAHAPVGGLRHFAAVNRELTYDHSEMC